MITLGKKLKIILEKEFTKRKESTVLLPTNSLLSTIDKKSNALRRLLATLIFSRAAARHRYRGGERELGCLTLGYESVVDVIFF